MEIINIIKEFEGIIGALAGVLVTLAYTEYLKRKGKVVIYVVDRKWEYHTFDRVGYLPNGKANSDLHDLTIEISLDIYNSSELPRVMRDIQLEFYVDKSLVHTSLPKDEATKRYTQISIEFEDFSINNIMPRQIQRVNLINYVLFNELSKIEHVDRIRLSYINEDDKKKHCDILTGKIKP